MKHSIAEIFTEEYKTKKRKRLIKDIKSLQKRRYKSARYDDRYRLFLVYATLQKDFFESENEYIQDLKEFNEGFLKPIYDWQVDIMASEIFEYDGNKVWKNQELAEFLEIKSYEVGARSALKARKGKVSYLTRSGAALYLGIEPKYLNILMSWGEIENIGKGKIAFLSRKLREYRLENPFWALRLKLYPYIDTFKKIDYIKQVKLGISEKGEVINLETFHIYKRSKTGKISVPIDGKMYRLDVRKLLARTYCENKLKKPYTYLIDKDERNLTAGNLFYVTKSEIDELDYLAERSDIPAYLRLVDDIKRENAGLERIDCKIFKIWEKERGLDYEQKV